MATHTPPTKNNPSTTINVPPKSTLLPLLHSTSALTFGTYTLKSGRSSPYFFNSSRLSSRPLSSAIGHAFADLLSHAPFSRPSPTDPSSMVPSFDILFGPAYKGIPLASIVVSHLPCTPNGAFDDVNFSYNRKEAKSHGEGGSIGGSPLSGKRVIVIDDVVTAGTALREAVSIIRSQGGEIVGVVVLLSRQERVSEEEPRSAMRVAEDELGVPVRAVITFEDLVGAVGRGEMVGVGKEEVGRMEEYRRRYGSRD